jgi:hypothetical protein
MEVESKNKIENIVICGIGAAGSNTFLHLLYAYPDINYTLVDFDKIEIRNIEPGTQPYSLVDLNRPKTQAMQRIAMALKKKKIDVFNGKINSKKDIENLVKDPSKTLIIDAFDNAVSRNIFLELKKHNVLHIGFSASLTGEAAWNEVFEPMVPSKGDLGIDVCEMTIARPFIFALTSLATLVISKFIEKGIKDNLYFDKYMIIKKY